jgi:5-methyltetrahydropteroyltriglutamate--homocysteine methyltransferase
MSVRTTPPFRADHVGSLLRPRALLDARDKHERGVLSASALRDAEDAAIAEAVTLQESVGLKAITDGEYRRTFFHLDFLEQIDGMETEFSSVAGTFQRDDGVDVKFAPPKLKVTGKLKRVKPIMRRDFEVLAKLANETPKITIPSPTMAHFRGGREAIDKTAYPELDAFFADLAQVYREEIDDLAAAGCRYLQLDDTNLAYLCDPAQRQRAKDRGEDPDTLPRTYAALINEAVKYRPSDMCLGIHLCRGNFKSAWVAEGGYEPVAAVLFNEMDIDAFFLEYDDERSGDFAPLRHLPKGKTAVLGLISTKKPRLETKDEIKARIDEAAKHVDIDQLALSPQCGFSSTCHGNDISPDVQRKKLELVVEVAEEVWG